MLIHLEQSTMSQRCFPTNLSIEIHRIVPLSAGRQESARDFSGDPEGHSRPKSKSLCKALHVIQAQSDLAALVSTATQSCSAADAISRRTRMRAAMLTPQNVGVHETACFSAVVELSGTGWDWQW